MRKAFSIIILKSFFSILYANDIKDIKNHAIELSSLKNDTSDVISEAQNKTLRWKLKVGDVIEIKKKSFQDIQISNEKHPKNFFSDHVQREVVNRIVLNTLAVDPKNGYLIEGSFNSFVNYKENSLSLNQEEESQDSTFFIQPRGILIVPPGNYMPNIRNIPVFPLDKDPSDPAHLMKEGDTWEFPGIEIMRVEELESIPLNVRYEYIGKENIKVGAEIKPIQKILYNVEFNHELKKTEKAENPKKIFGYVIAKLIWDEKEGMPYYMTEDYDIVIMYNNGVNHEFRINSKTNYVKKPRLDQTQKEQTTREISERVHNYLNGSNVEVQSIKKGITIQIPDVLFMTDAANLNNDSIKVLKKVGQIVKKYMGNKQILIRGHTDNTGAAEHNQQLSTERAKSVAKYLVDNFDISVESLSYEGAGSEMPVAENDTASGRMKNRRVEIILLDN